MPRESEAPSRDGPDAPDAPSGYDAIWEWGLGSGEVVWSRDFGGGFGYADPDLVPDLAWWRERVHPNDPPADEASRSASTRSRSFGFEPTVRDRSGLAVRAQAYASDSRPKTRK